VSFDPVESADPIATLATELEHLKMALLAERIGRLTSEVANLYAQSQAKVQEIHALQTQGRRMRVEIASRNGIVDPMNAPDAAPAANGNPSQLNASPRP